MSSIMTTSGSIVAATSYLTQPLIRSKYDTTSIAILDQTLKSLLQTAADAHPTGTLYLPFSPIRCPPTLVYEAARIAGVQSSEWMALLVLREFLLIVTKTAVRVEYGGLNPSTQLIWAQAEAATMVPRKECQSVPISQLGQRQGLRAIVASAHARTVARPVLAPITIPSISLTPPAVSSIAKSTPRLTMHPAAGLNRRFIQAAINADSDDIFARLGRAQAGFFSPSPTRAVFNSAPHSQAAAAAIQFAFSAFPAPLSAPSVPTTETSDIESDSSSRPSSPASSFASSGAESLSSATSFASSTLPTSSPADKVASWRSAAPFVPRLAKKTPVVVDNTKKDVQKYLYQGGVSTVLTGGVMLGAPSKKPTTTAKRPTSASAEVPRYRAPISQGVPSWRRRAAPASSTRV